LAASILECIHFAKQDGTALLNPAIVAAADDLVPIDDY